MVAEWAATPDPSPGNPCASAVDNRITRLVPATFAATPPMDQEPRELSGSRSSHCGYSSNGTIASR